jgi:hypothetical protein
LGGAPVVRDINSPEGQAAAAKGFKGLLVYLPTQVVEIDKFTQTLVLGADGKTLVASGECDSEHAATRKVVTVVDRSTPYLLQYHHGLLETYTFAATLTPDGALASINTSSTPDQGKTLANLASTASTAAGIAKLDVGAPTPGQKLCTQTPIFVRYEPLDPIPRPRQ